MAVGDQQKSQYTAWTQVITVILLTFGAIWLPSLESTRPPSSGQGLHKQGIQNIDARLWQDPYATNDIGQKTDSDCIKIQTASADLELMKTKCTGSPQDLGWLMNLIEQKLNHHNGNNYQLAVIYGLVSAGNSVGADEKRRQMRYAVLTGMMSKDYYPKDTEHLGHVDDNIDQIPIHLRFEWFSKKDSKDEALLIWIDESALEQDSFKKIKNEPKLTDHGSGPTMRPNTSWDWDYENPTPLAGLLAIHEQLSDFAVPGNASISYTILGPASSEFLYLANNEYCWSDESATKYDELSEMKTKPVKWYSPIATLPNNELICSSGAQSGTSILDKIQIIRTIDTDDSLIDPLVKELRARRVGSVYLVGQWDTAYARGLTKYFREKWCGVAKVKCSPKKKCDTEETCHIYEATYLRGLDGHTGQRSENADSKAQTGQGTDNKDSTEPEHPEGAAQLDYLRRLGDIIRNDIGGQHNDSEDKDSPNVAVGIFGNDYHDKLLVLQELHAILPQAVFFTTDLDAAMFHPKDNKYTRNLVVASSYPLSVERSKASDADDKAKQDAKDDKARYVAPFRSNYQTSVYFTIRKALSTAQIDTDQLKKAKVYEIGRKNAVELNDQPVQEGEGTIKSEDAGLSKKQIIAIIAAPLIILLLWILSILAGYTSKRIFVLWLLSEVFSIGTALMLYASQLFDAPEPLSLLEGISIWPSEVIRLFMILLAVYLLYCGHAAVKATSKTIMKRHGLGEGSQIDKVQASDTEYSKIEDIWKWYVLEGKRPDVRIGAQDNDAPTPNQNPTKPEQTERTALIIAKSKWLSEGPWGWRLILFIPILILLFVWISFVLHLDRPVSPLRGVYALYADKIIIISVLVTFIALLFYTLHRLSLAIGLAKKLSQITIWPSKAIDHFVRHSVGYPIQERTQQKSEIVYQDWLNAQLLATATVPVQRLVFYSLTIWVLLILSRSHLIDGWHTPPFLYLIFSIYALMIIVPAATLRHKVEKLRTDSLRRLDYRLMDAQGQGNELHVRQIESMVRQLKELKVGAFAPISHQPLFQAALAILGSISGLKVLEYLS